MSYVSSGKKSSTPSILKKTGRPSLRQSLGHAVRFRLDSNIKPLLENYLEEKDRQSYVDLICKIRDAGHALNDEDFISLLLESKSCLDLLNENLKLFVQVLMILKWTHRSEEAMAQYKDFLFDICTAYSGYTKFALQQLVASFRDVNENNFNSDCLISETEERIFQHIHEAIRSLLKIVPMSKIMLLRVIQMKFPFRKESARSHLYYAHNILIMSNYEPLLRREIISLIINKSIHLDVIASKEEIEKAECNGSQENYTEEVFAMEVDEPAVGDMRHEVAQKLDYCLYELLHYLREQCHDEQGRLKWNNTMTLYADMLAIFQDIILPTYGSSHTQFVMLYMLSLKESFVENFLKVLWGKVVNPNSAPVARQAAASYIAGLLAKGKFVSMKILKRYISKMALWLCQYVDYANIVIDDPQTMLRIHGGFYGTCQGLFYLIAYRHADLVDDKNLKFLENLNLGKIVTSRFNPLAFCSEVVVKSFTHFANIYQLTYCKPVLTNFFHLGCPKSDHWLDEFFPFDSYLLKRSGDIIRPIFRESKQTLSEELPSTSKNEDSQMDMDDFIQSGVSPNSPQVPILLSTSPFCNAVSSPRS